MKNNILFPLVIMTSVFVFGLSCGATAPDIKDGFCPKDGEPSSVVTSTTNVSVSSGGAGGAGTSVSTAVATSGTGSGMGEEFTYDVPQNDEIVSRLHSCKKLTYTQLGNFLLARGVAVPLSVSSDLKSTTTNVFGSSQTLSQIFGGSGLACEMADTAANGSGLANDPLCLTNEVCFCNQDDKQNEVNRTCLDVGNNSPDAKDGYCVSKLASAGYLYFTGKNAFGVPKLDSRLGEKDEHTTASSMRLMDVFVQSAPQIISNIGDPAKAPACTLNGKNRPMFDPVDGSCVEESVSCLIGQPATDDHMLLCNLILQKAKPGDQADLNKKRSIAVAVLLSAAHSCQ